MFKVKLVLYLLCSDFLITINSQLNQASVSPRTRFEFGKAGSGRREKVNLDSTQSPVISNNDNEVANNFENLPSLNSSEIKVPQNDSAHTNVFETPNNNNTSESYPETSSPDTASSDTTTEGEQTTTTEISPSDKSNNPIQTGMSGQQSIDLQIQQEKDYKRYIGQPDYKDHTIDSGTTVYGGSDASKLISEFEEVTFLNERRTGIKINVSELGIEGILTQEEGGFELQSGNFESFNETDDKEKEKVYENKFINQQYLMQSASHGIFYHQYGELLLFQEKFEHFVRLH